MRNPQRINKSSRRSRIPKPVKQPRQHRSKKVEFQGIEFDSQTEFLYYRHLKNDPTVRNIQLQPEFQIIDSYKVTCKRCVGVGTITNVNTGNANKCRLCSGKGRRDKPGAKYTADFEVTYIDGLVEVVDIKGGPVTRDFPLRKKLFEMKTGVELIVIRLKDGEWVRE